MRGAKLTYEGVANLTLGQTSSESATNEAKMSESKPGTELEEPIIEEEESGDDNDTGGVNQEEKIPPLDKGPQLIWSTKECQPSIRYPSSEYILIADKGEPESFQEIQSHKDTDCWIKAMREEMNSLWKNDTYELIELLRGRKALKNKWVFKLKNDDEKLLKYKARLVVKGFDQKQGIDFDEIFSLVVKMCSILVILGLTASMNLELEQLDVKTTFLHGDLDEEIFIEQPEGFKVKGKENMVCKLKKSIYGLKQVSRQWYKKFNLFMMSQEYKRIFADPYVYVRRFPDDKFIILLLYVDDMLIVG